jgi:DNA polymerase-3 subunit gamma/tau
LNCEQGPTDTPCGVCPSCVELSRDGGGSLDVVEIDAASHNGVDDARELRERAVFAPARDRFKIFILDEAHMVTPQGFNALLKIVEEPPEHVKFIFATTEPDKVIGTIRSRTHHYPFRLVPPAELLRYVEQMCSTEGVAVEEGVLPLVVRAGGGSVRDTLSVLDQLIAGSPDANVTYNRAVALLGYTHGELLAEVMTAIASGDGQGSFQALDKVIHSGQDPRRFAEDLLEFTRDIIVVDAAGSAATALLPGTSAPVIDQMTEIARSIGGPRLSAVADVINDALTAMTGATSPKLHLELLMARLLVSMGTSATPQPVALPTAPPSTQKLAVPANASQPVAPAPVSPESAPSGPAEPLSLDLMLASWGKIVEAVGEKKRAVWTALANTEVVGLVDDVVTIGFPSLASADVLKKPQGPGLPVNAELVRDAILAVSGHRVRFKVQELVLEAVAGEQAATVVQEVPTVVEATARASWPTVTLPGAEEQTVEEVAGESLDEAPEEADAEAETLTTGTLSQVGEAVIREVLGGQLVSEHPVDGAKDK